MAGRFGGEVGVDDAARQVETSQPLIGVYMTPETVPDRPDPSEVTDPLSLLSAFDEGTKARLEGELGTDVERLAARALEASAPRATVAAARRAMGVYVRAYGPSARANELKKALGAVCGKGRLP